MTELLASCKASYLPLKHLLLVPDGKAYIRIHEAHLALSCVTVCSLDREFA